MFQIKNKAGARCVCAKLDQAHMCIQPKFSSSNALAFVSQVGNKATDPEVQALSFPEVVESL